MPGTRRPSTARGSTGSGCPAFSATDRAGRSRTAGEPRRREDEETRFPDRHGRGCGRRAACYPGHCAELPDDLKQAVAQAFESLYNPVWTEYLTNHARALQQLVETEGVQVHKLPEDVMIALGNATGEVIGEMRENDEELVRRITESFLAYRELAMSYKPYADNGQMNARQLDYTW